MDGESEADTQRAEAWRAAVNVRRRDSGSPKPARASEAMTGESPVQVTPNHALPSGAGPQVNNFNFARPESPKTQTQIAARLSYEQRRAARFGA